MGVVLPELGQLGKARVADDGMVARHCCCTASSPSTARARQGTRPCAIMPAERDEQGAAYPRGLAEDPVDQAKMACMLPAAAQRLIKISAGNVSCRLPQGVTCRGSAVRYSSAGAKILGECRGHRPLIRWATPGAATTVSTMALTALALVDAAAQPAASHRSRPMRPGRRLGRGRGTDKRYALRLLRAPVRPMGRLRPPDDPGIVPQCKTAAERYAAARSSRFPRRTDAAATAAAAAAAATCRRRRWCRCSPPSIRAMGYLVRIELGAVDGGVRYPENCCVVGQFSMNSGIEISRDAAPSAARPASPTSCAIVIGQAATRWACRSGGEIASAAGDLDGLAMQETVALDVVVETSRRPSGGLGRSGVPDLKPCSRCAS